MEKDNGNEPTSQLQDQNAHPSTEETLRILKQYSRGEISDRDAAELLGKGYTQHDVFALVRKHHIPLPVPPPEVIQRELAALEAVFGPGKKKS